MGFLIDLFRRKKVFDYGPNTYQGDNTPISYTINNTNNNTTNNTTNYIKNNSRNKTEKLIIGVDYEEYPLNTWNGNG